GPAPRGSRSDVVRAPYEPRLAPEATGQRDGLRGGLRAGPGTLDDGRGPDPSGPERGPIALDDRAFFRGEPRRIRVRPSGGSDLRRASPLVRTPDRFSCPNHRRTIPRNLHVL